MRRPAVLLLALVLLVAACSSDDDGGGAAASTTAADGAEASTTTTAAPGGPAVELGAESERYADLALWHCHPDLADDACDTADLSATTVLPDGSLEPVAFTPAEDPTIDCFYVYPTVDQSPEPGVRGFDEPINPVELIVIQNTFARYGQVCRLFAPRYEQMTIGGYGSDQFEDLFAVGDAQVVEAFDHYLATQNDGRPFVLVGHSQGTHHLVRMLQERFEGDGDVAAALRSQLVTALLLGPTGWIEVPDGAAVGGTFESVPLCTGAEELGCIVAYDSYRADVPPDPESPFAQDVPEGMVRACTNPADLAAGEEPVVLGGPHLSRATEGVSTPTEIWPGRYTARCARDAAGQPFLEISDTPAAGDVRTEVVLERFGVPSLHLLDPNLGMGDLLELLAGHAAVLAG